jgi:pimeloyl-ACP methyl ester carboxylesterase
MNVYFISGIAADGRLFRRIILPEGVEAVYLNWIKPLQNELLKSYALRMAEKIEKNKPFVLIGTSLGGIVATEIALSHPPLALIIIGSVPSDDQLPGYYRLVEKTKIHRLFPGSLYNFSAKVKHYFTREDAEDKKIILQMLTESDPSFVRWGINAVLEWRNREIPEGLHHIHGTRDEIFPYKYTKPTHTISKGDHVIVITRAEEVNRIIAEIFDEIRKEDKPEMQQ